MFRVDRDKHLLRLQHAVVSVSLSVDESYHEHNQREHWWEILVDLSDDCPIPG